MALGEARLDHTSMVESHSWLFVVTLVARLLHALLDKSICISIKFNKSNFYCKYNYTHLKKVYIRLNKSWTKLINLWTILQYIYKIIWSLSLSLSLSLQQEATLLWYWWGSLIKMTSLLLWVVAFSRGSPCSSMR